MDFITKAAGLAQHTIVQSRRLRLVQLGFSDHLHVPVNQSVSRHVLSLELEPLIHGWGGMFRFSSVNKVWDIYVVIVRAKEGGREGLK